jgi:hypothetical protein
LAASHLQSNPICVDSHGPACLKSATRQVLGKPVSAIFARFRRCPRNGKRYDTASTATAPARCGKAMQLAPTGPVREPGDRPVELVPGSRGGRLGVWRRTAWPFHPTQLPGVHCFGPCGRAWKGYLQ